MVYQEDLREEQAVAIWVGNIGIEGDLTDYLGTPFESDFGFLLDYDDLPEFSRSFSEPRLHAHYNRPFLKTDVGQLLSALACSGEWIDEAVRLCRRKGFYSAKTVVVFQNLRYPPELEPTGKTAPGLFGEALRRLGLSNQTECKLHFVGNLPWPSGKQAWADMQSKRTVMPPFPKLIRHDFSGEGSDLWHWKAKVSLESWKGFATYSDISSMGWSPTKGCLPDGDFEFTVYPVSRIESRKPTMEQAKAFEILTRNQSQLREAVLDAVYKVYPQWRKNHFDGQWSSDGGKTYKTGWELPEMFRPEEMPEIKSPSEMSLIIRPGSFGILAESNHGVAQIRIGFSCKWDEEHGFGVLIRGGKEIEVGDSDLGI